MENDWKSIGFVVLFDIVLVIVIGFIAWKVTAWALLCLIFLGSTPDKLTITLKNGTKIEASGSDAIEIANKIKTETDNP